MTNRKRAIPAILFGAVLTLTACASGSGSVDIAQQLELGQKYLTDMDYENAVIAFSKVIQIEARHIEANRQISLAYRELGKTEEAAEAMLNVVLSDGYEQIDLEEMGELLLALEDPSEMSVMVQMAYARTGDESFIPILFKAKGREKNFDGVVRLIRDVDVIFGMKDEYLQEAIQDYFEDGDYEAMKQLSEVLNQEETCEGMALVLQLLDAYQVNGENGIIELLETYYTNEEEFPTIDQDGEMYIGGYDENGLRSGFGICFYGTNVKTDSRIYVGNWEAGMRSGEGRAYRTASYRIQCSWTEDYPNGEVTILQDDITVLGTLAYGHVATPMNLYEDGEWTAVHCTPDETKSSGYSFQTAEMDRPGTCEHVRKHSYCWDCRKKEEEEREEA